MLPLLIVAFSLIAGICMIVYRLNSKTSSLPPGPRAIPLIGHLHLLTNPSKAPPHKVLQALSQRYGPVLSLQFGNVPVVVASNANAAKEFLKTHDSIFASRPPSASARILVHDSDLVFAPYGDRWRQLRKLTTLELLTARRIEMFKEARREEVRALCHSVSESASSRSSFNVRAGLTALTFNLITFMLMSKRFFGNKVNDEQESADFMDIIFKTFEVCGEFPIGDYFPALKFVDPVESRMKLVGNALHSFLQANIVEREKQRNLELSSELSSEKTPDFLDVMLDLREQGEKELQGQGLKALMTNLLTAGTDTSAVTLEWILAEMITHPEVMTRAQQELDRVVGRERMVEESDISELEYLQAIVKESMRLHAVAPLLVPHQSMEACKVLGYTVAKNTTLIVNAYAIGRDPSVWEDPLAFKPERFIGSDIDVKGQHFELIPFGAGRRMCPGMALALTTVHLALANLVHQFDWREADGLKIDTTSEHYGLTLTLGSKLLAVPCLRLNK